MIDFGLKEFPRFTDNSLSLDFSFPHVLEQHMGLEKHGSPFFWVYFKLDPLH
jgi:hypothetical protein